MPGNKLVLCLLFLVPGLVYGVGEVYYTNSRQIRLPCAIERGPAGIKMIEIWVTSNKGQDWKKINVVTNKDEPLLCRLEKDGTYGFKTVVHGNNNLKEAPPRKGDTPDLSYVVDTVKPVITITTSKETHIVKSGEEVDIAWEVSDPLIKEETCLVEFSKDGGRTWNALSIGILKGARKLMLSLFLNPTLIKVTAADAAGNISSKVIGFSVVASDSKIPVATVKKKPESSLKEKKDSVISEKKETPEKVTQGKKADKLENPIKKVIFTIISNVSEGYDESTIVVEEEYYEPSEAKEISPEMSEYLKTVDLVIIDPKDQKKIEKAEPSKIKKKKEPAKIVKEKREEKITPEQVQQMVSGKAIFFCDKAIDAEIFGNFSDARKYYLVSLNREPHYYRARKGLAELYVRYGYHKKALGHFGKVLQLDPDNTSVRVKYAFCLYKLGRKDDAEIMLKKVLTVDPGNDDALWYLGKVHKDNNNIKSAVYVWIRIVNKGPRNNKWFEFAQNYISIYSPDTMY